MSAPQINKLRNLLRTARAKVFTGVAVISIAIGAFTLYYDPVSGELGVSTQVSK